MVLGGDSVVGELGAAATKLDPSNIGLFSALRPAMDLSTAAYRYNQNMMEYYTCEYRFYCSTRVNPIEHCGSRSPFAIGNLC